MSTDVGQLEVTLELTDKNSRVVIARAGETLKEFTGNLRVVNASMDEHEQKHASLARSFRNFMVTIAATRFALLDFNQIFLSLPRGAIKAGAEIERLTTLMKGLSKEVTDAKRTAEANANAAFVIKTAQSSPFQVKAIADAFVKLKTAGIDPANGSLQALLDGVAKFGGDSEILHRAAIAIQQMAGKGVISMEELRQQLGEAIPTAMRSMAQGLGLTMDELVKQVSKGTIRSLPALQRMFMVMKAENDGASAAMMKTWNGVAAQIETQWMLIQNTVFQSGFGDQMKEIANDVLGILKSDEAKQFAVNFGQGLRDVAAFARDMARSFGEAWPIIKVTGEVFAAYFAVTNINKAREALNSFIKAQITSVEQSRAKTVAEMEAKQAAAIEELALVEKSLQTKLAAGRAEMIANKEKLVRMQNDLLIYEAEVAAIQARMNARGQLRDAATGRLGTVAEGQRILQNAQFQAQAQQIVIEKAKQEALALESTVVATRAAQIEKARLVTTLAATGEGLAAAAGRAAAFRAALGLLGGPLGILLTTLSIIIPLWMEFGNKGEEAIKKIKNALDSKTANMKDVETLDAEIERRKLKIDELQKFIDRRKAENPKDYDKVGNTPQLIAQLNAEKADLQKLGADRVEAYRQARQNVAQKEVQIENDIVTQRLQALSINHNALIQGVNDNEKKLLEGIVAGSDKYKQIQQQANKDRTKVDVDYFNQRVAILRERSVALKNEIVKAEQVDANNPSLNGKKAALASITTELVNAQEQARYAADHLGNTLDVLAKKNDGKETPAEKFIRSLKQEIVQLSEELTNRGDKMAQTLAKIKDPRPGTDNGFTKAQADEALHLAAQVDAMKSQIDAKKKILSLDEQAKGQIASLNASLEGEGSASAKLGVEIEHLWATMFDVDPATMAAINALERLRATMKKLEEQAKDRAAANWVKNIHAETMTLRASLGTQDEALRDIFERDKARKLEEIENMKVSNEKKKGLMAEYYVWLQERTEQFNRAMVGPLDRLVRDWADVNMQLKQSWADWTQDAMNTFMDFATKGENRMGQFVQKILADLLRIEMQANIVGPLARALNSYIPSLIGGLFGGSGAVTGTNQDAGGGTGPTFAANGHVMTADGPLSLKKYAYGGIAKSAHVAIFGEGSTPEAYVPLPDGRTIPVTMRGGGEKAAPTNVVVNVINQSGQQVQAEQKGMPRFDGRQMILDVVLSAANQPGKFRDGMKGALKP
jgi:tape measure domain-containing protein